MSEPFPIAATGMYSNVSREQYHGACTVDPSISASHVAELVDECPALFWANYYMNPQCLPKASKKAFDFGEAAHLLLLEPEKFHEAVILSPYEEFRSNEAKAWKAQTLKSGQIILKPEELLQLKAMRESAMNHPIAKELFAMQGLIEQTLIYRDPETGVMCKSRPDWMPASFQYVVDIKTAADPNPREFEKAIANHNYYAKMAWQADALEQVHGTRPQGFFFIVIGSKAPFLSIVAMLDPEAVEYGTMKCRKARDLFAQCMAKDEWPGYVPSYGGAFHVGLPGWETQNLKNRTSFGDFTTTADLAKAAAQEAAKAAENRAIDASEYGV